MILFRATPATGGASASSDLQHDILRRSGGSAHAKGRGDLGVYFSLAYHPNEMQCAK
jgi:hypothetical protein